MSRTGEQLLQAFVHRGRSITNRYIGMPRPASCPQTTRLESPHHDLRQHPRHHRPHSHRPDQPARAGGNDDVREVRVLQSALLGQGSPRDRHHRRRRAQRHAEAGPDRGRGHLGQHRHRARHGVRREGLSLRRRDGRNVLHRAPQDHAHARREGDPHARRRTRPGHGGARPPSWRRSTAGSSRGSSRTRRTRPITATPRARKSSRTSSASGSTTSSRAGAPAARSPAPARSSSSRARTPRSSCPSPRPRSC